MKEHWRAVVGFEDLYEVSDLGRVRSDKGFKKPSSQGTGYLCVWLYRQQKVKNCLVSRLVLEAFVGEPPSVKHEAAHWNGDRSDNRLSNLRWATHMENEADKDRHDTRLVRVGEAVGRLVLVGTDIERIRDLRRMGCKQLAISSWIRTSPSNVCYILQKRLWAHV